MKQRLGQSFRVTSNKDLLSRDVRKGKRRFLNHTPGISLNGTTQSKTNFHRETPQSNESFRKLTHALDSAIMRQKELHEENQSLRIALNIALLMKSRQEQAQ